MEQIHKYLKTIDSNVLEIITKGICFSVILSIISTLILSIYVFNYHIPSLFYIGFSIMKTSIYYIVFFIICGISFNKIKKDLLL